MLDTAKACLEAMRFFNTLVPLFYACFFITPNTFSLCLVSIVSLDLALYFHED